MEKENKVRELEKERSELEKKLSDPELLSHPDAFKNTAQKLKEVRETLRYATLRELLEKRQEEAEGILATSHDQTLRTLAEEELRTVTQERSRLEAAAEERTVKERGKESVLLEVRPGTGGEEAALFAGDLARMYQRFAERKGWSVTLLEDEPTELKGKKLVILELSGRGARALQFESGVHRVQRIPVTEKSGRIHTSAATIAVLPKPAAAEVAVDPKDLEIEVMRSSGAGGQLVNRRESAVRITHKPTGITVKSHTARTQIQNRENAMAILRARIYEQKQQQAHTEQRAERKSQIGTGDRSEKIRTYNFPQDRVTDHRLKKSWHNLERILDGDINEILQAMEHAAAEISKSAP